MSSYYQHQIEALLKVVRSTCRNDRDTRRCSYTKDELECSVACGECRGISCTNSPILPTEDGVDTHWTSRVSEMVKCAFLRVHFDSTCMLSELAYRPNVISSEFVIDYDSEFANNKY